MFLANDPLTPCGPWGPRVPQGVCVRAGGVCKRRQGVQAQTGCASAGSKAVRDRLAAAAQTFASQVDPLGLAPVGYLGPLGASSGTFPGLGLGLGHVFWDTGKMVPSAAFRGAVCILLGKCLITPVRPARTNAASNIDASPFTWLVWELGGTRGHSESCVGVIEGLRWACA